MKKVLLLTLLPCLFTFCKKKKPEPAPNNSPASYRALKIFRGVITDNNVGYISISNGTYQYGTGGVLSQIAFTDSSKTSTFNWTVNNFKEFFTYNSANKLIRVNYNLGAASFVEFYDYNASGQLIRRRTSDNSSQSTETNYTYNGTRITGAFINSADSSTTRYFISNNLDSMVHVDKHNNLINKTLYHYNTNIDLLYAYLNAFQQTPGILFNSNELLSEENIAAGNAPIITKHNRVYDSQGYPIRETAGDLVYEYVYY